MFVLQKKSLNKSAVNYCAQTWTISLKQGVVFFQGYIQTQKNNF